LVDGNRHENRHKSNSTLKYGEYYMCEKVMQCLHYHYHRFTGWIGLCRLANIVHYLVHGQLCFI